ILRNFSLPASARFTVMDKIVANLCRDHDFIPLIRKSFRDQFFAQSVSVSIARIKKIYTEIESLVHQCDRFALGEISPPAGRNRPETKPDLAYSQVGVLVRSEAHMLSA